VRSHKQLHQISPDDTLFWGRAYPPGGGGGGVSGQPEKGQGRRVEGVGGEKVPPLGLLNKGKVQAFDPRAESFTNRASHRDLEMSFDSGQMEGNSASRYREVLEEERKKSGKGQTRKTIWENYFFNSHGKLLQLLGSIVLQLHGQLPRLQQGHIGVHEV